MPNSITDIHHIKEAALKAQRQMFMKYCTIVLVLCLRHGLSQQGVWVSFWTPKPWKSTLQDTQFCLWGISLNVNLKHIIDFFHLHIIHITLYKDIMPCFVELVHVYGWNLSILWFLLKIWTPKTFTIANFRHQVSKSWLRPCMTTNNSSIL